MKPGADWPIAAALLLLIAAVWMPPLTLQRPIFNYMITFDITQSMDVEDVQQDGVQTSRLELARGAMRQTLRRLPCGSKIGWSIFADYRALPLTVPVEVCTHYEELQASLDRIDGRMRWANASNIGKGVAWTVRSAKSIDADVSVVFITDGHESPPLRSGETPTLADITPGEVRGWLIGVGGLLPARIPRTDREGNAAGFWEAADVVQRSDASSHEHLSELRETHLQSLARLMGLRYRRLVDADALESALLSPQLARPAAAASDLRWAPALLALLLLAWRFRPSRRDGRRRTPSGVHAWPAGASRRGGGGGSDRRAAVGRVG